MKNNIYWYKSLAKTRNRWRSGSCLMLMLVLLLACSEVPRTTAERIPAQDVQATVTIDMAMKFQTINGFGTSERVFDDPHVFNNFNSSTGRAATVMTTAQQDAVFDLLYKDLNLTHVRPVTEGNVERQNDNSDPEITDLSKFDFSWKGNDAHVEYVKKAMARGMTTFFLSPLRRESWMGATTVNEVAEYVEWAMAIVRRWRQLGVELPYYSPANEPGLSNINPMSGEFIRDVIKRMGPKLQAEGFATKFLIPDDVTPADALLRCNVILSDPEARRYVGALGVHLYGDLGALASLRSVSESYGIPLWMTEYSRRALGGNGFTWAALMHDLISRYNVSAVYYMWGYFGVWTGGGDYLVGLSHNGSGQYTGAQPDKEFYTMGQYSRYVLPGMQRVQAQSTDQDVKTTAYTSGNKLVIVAVNNTLNDKTVRFMLNNAGNLQTVNPIRTSETENWAQLPPLEISGSAFIATLPKSSVTTFVTATTSSPPPPVNTSPTISSVSIVKKLLIVIGENFDADAALLLNDKPVANTKDETSPSTTIRSKKGAKKIAVGDTVRLQVQNSNGAVSNQFLFTRP